MPRRKSYLVPKALLACVLFCACGCTLQGEQAGLRFSDRPAPALAPATTGVFPVLPAYGAAAIGATSSSVTGFEAPGRVNTVAVVSFNMQHRDRPEELAVMADGLESLEGRPPDFILCQEVLFDRPRHKGRADTAAVLADELGYHSRGAQRKSDEEGVAIISRYPFAHFEARHLKARTSALLLGFKRVSVMGEFLVPGLGRVRVVNVHFAYQGFEHHVRRKQLAETMEWVAARERRVPADLTILGGDFNMTPDRKEWEVLADGALEFLDANGSAPTRGSTANPTKRVDYIFAAAADRHVWLLREKLLFANGLWNGPDRFWISDHLPVYHEYAVYPDTLAAAP